MQRGETQTPSHLTHLGLGAFLAWIFFFALSIQSLRAVQSHIAKFNWEWLEGHFFKRLVQMEEWEESRVCCSDKRNGEWRTRSQRRASEQVVVECWCFLNGWMGGNPPHALWITQRPMVWPMRSEGKHMSGPGCATDHCRWSAKDIKGWVC